MRYDEKSPPKEVTIWVRFTDPSFPGTKVIPMQVYDGTDYEKLLQAGKRLVLLGYNYTSKELV